MSDKDLLEYKKTLEYDISKYHNFQLVRKVQLNSAYGALGNQWFRFYSTDLAEAITLSGQLAIQWIGLRVNELLNEVSGNDGKDYVIASDTDSIYIGLNDIVNKFNQNKSKKEKIDYLDNVSEKVILPFIKKQCEYLAFKMNAYENRIFMSREVIADKGVWTAKKRYMLNVWDSEGVRYDKPKSKIMGIETSRSSTPEVVRNKLKEAIQIVLNGNENELIQFVESCKKEFNEYYPEQIAFPRSVNGLDKYKDNQRIYKKSTPIAVKAALLYNHYIDKFDLSKKYPKILEGEKIKFIHLKKPNPLSGAMGEDCVIAFVSKIPKEFDIEKFIDYNGQFEKAFIDPLKNIMNSIGWNYEKKNTLESLFV